jgi:predicted kinase
VESRQGDASEAGIAVLESQLAAWEPPDASCEDGVVEVVDRGLEALAALLSGGAADDAGG